MSDPLNIEKLKVFCKLLEQYRGSFAVSTSRTLIFNGNPETIQPALAGIGISGSVDIDGFLISLAGIAGRYKIVFERWLDQDFDDTNLLTDTIFIHLSGEYVLYQNGIITEHSVGEDFKNEISTIVTYYKLARALKVEAVSDHHNEARKEFVFYSSTRGVIKIAYSPVAPKRQLGIQADKVDSLIQNIAAPNHKIFFINGLFKISNEKTSIDLLTIIDNAESLTTIIKRDYEITLKQFDFEKFKDNLLKEKDKYFNSIREIINKVFGQLIGIPISISASAFATYKVEHEPFTLALIFFGFIFYVVLYVKIQLTYKSDLMEIQSDFERDFDDIKLKSGLATSVIEGEKGKIENKINRTRSMINLLIGGITVLGISFVLYLGNQFLIALMNFNLMDFLIRVTLGCRA
jgi:hypothetical protein